MPINWGSWASGFCTGNSLLILLVLGVSVGVRYWQTAHRRLPLPPGPSQLGLLGHLRQESPRNFPDLSRRWHQQYGPIFSFRCGQRVVVSLGSQDVVHELLNKRGGNYSDRPRMVIAGSVTNGMNMAAMPISERWQGHRRIVSNLLSGQLTKKYCTLQDLESKQLLVELLDSNDFFKGFERFSASFIYTLTYGKRMQHAHEEEEMEIRGLLDQLLDSLAMSYYVVVEIFPVLDGLPAFLAPWKRLGSQVHTYTMAILERNLHRAQDRPAWNWVQESMRMKGTQTVSQADIASIMGVLAEGGVESTATTLKVFVMAAVLYPNTVRQAQEELDRVIGEQRIPNFDDMVHLPYLKGMMLEVLRWRSIAPFGLFHSNSQADNYMGYRIPAKSCVIANVWTLDNDPSIFPNPSEFQPTRWIENPALPVNSFGYGRRVCPGRAVAENSLLINMARILWAFDISHTYKDGEPVTVDPDNFIFRLSLTPAPFEASFRVRGVGYEKIVREAWETSVKDPQDALNRIPVHDRSAL